MTVSVRTVDDVQYENRLRNFDFDIIIGGMGRSRCRPATSSAISGARQAADRPGSRNLRRHQEPGGRRLDRPHHLCQRPRRAGRALPRRSIACCCGTAMSCRNSPIGFDRARALGSLQPSRAAAEIRRHGFPDAVVVGCGEGGQDGQTLLSRAPRRARALAPPCARPRRRCAERAMASSPRAPR